MICNSVISKDTDVARFNFQYYASAPKNEFNRLYFVIHGYDSDK